MTGGILDKIQKLLKEIIDQNGIDYLQREPYRVYQHLAANGIPVDHARLVLVTLMAEASKNAREMETESLSKDLQKSCFLRKKPADEISAMYKSLFDDGNLSSWKEKENLGFEELCDGTWSFSWEGSGIWSRGGGHYDCDASVTADVKVVDRDLAFNNISSILQKNPFTDADTLFEYFQDQMEGALEADLEEYITCDDYYPPVMEDYHHNAKYALEEVCKELGFTIVHFSCSGDMSDFEPDHMRW
ncbi:MAG: hypothetical protein IKE58_07295 [Blautia sp.]|nr:hypothetical protein [Blautia sp.]